MNKTQFLHQVQDLTGLPTSEETEAASMIVLSLLSHRLTPDEKEDVTSQLPSDLKELWNSDTWFSNFINISRHKQLKYRKKEELFSMIQNETAKKQLEVDVDRLTTAVFSTLKQQISKGEVEDIASQLPDDIEQIWLAA